MIRIHSLDNKFALIIILFLVAAAVNDQAILGQFQDFGRIFTLIKSWFLGKDVFAELDIVKEVQIMG